MNIDKQQEKYYRALEAFGEAPDRAWKQLMRAICWTKLGQYAKALQVYKTAIHGMLEDYREWRGSSEPNILVDTFVMANEPLLYPRVRKEIEEYRLDRRGTSPIANYASAITLLLANQDEDALKCVPELVKRPKIKDMLAIGQIIRALVEHNQVDFSIALDELLDAHNGMVKFGALRETPEGFLCLPAMSLSRITLDRGLNVNTKSEYLSLEYLTLIGKQMYNGNR
jgi:tetratricopeptide (TPR) repeat protein